MQLCLLFNVCRLPCRATWSWRSTSTSPRSAARAETILQEFAQAEFWNPLPVCHATSRGAEREGSEDSCHKAD
ncbi:hypothetical protein N7516_010829 [Penicillium verrucosum]|uniref:uncharacterized protein n=1 Tax=Penicillium verrucosum TaxID=60171 RepID=UPI0025451090|nr:uncharacterized protein N7516_010829 [Penicillium verrucosum]KAJ5923126.1 hypothetical protein N7516_010829 [Penicillium verrucosum]